MGWKDTIAPVAQAAEAPPAAPRSWKDTIAPIAPPVEKDEGALAAAGAGAAHGLSFGLYDKAKAAAQAAVGDESFGSAYDKRLLEQRAAREKLAEQHPVAYYGADIGSAIVNPLNALIPGGGLLAGGRIAARVGEGVAGLGGHAIGGALTGAVQAAGESKAHPLESYDQLKQYLDDVYSGAKYGIAGAGAGAAIGKAVSAVPGIAKKASSVLLGANEDAVSRYIANAEAVTNAPSLTDQVGNVKGRVSSLLEKMGDESEASRKILDQAEKKYTGADINQFGKNQIENMVQSSQGALTPEQKSAISTIEKYMEPYAANPEKEYTGGQLKTLMKSLDTRTTYNQMPGQSDLVDNAALKRLRSSLNEEARTVPDYATTMDELSRKSKVLEDANQYMTSDQGLMNTLNRVRRERAPFAEEALNNLDKEFGTNTVEELKNALAREAFQKGAQGPGGSRNVQMYSHLLGEALDKQSIPFGRAIGGLVGGAVDKLGPGAAKAGIDAYRGAKSITMNPTIRSYLEAAQRTGEAARVSPNINPAISQYLIDKYLRQKP